MHALAQDQDVLSPEQRRPAEPFSTWRLRSVSMQEWAALWAPVQVPALLHARRPDQSNLWYSRVLGDLVGARFASGCEMFRHDGTALARSGDLIAVQRLHDGLVAMEYPERNYMHQPGQIAISDLRQPFRGSFHHAVMEQILLPRAALGLAEFEPFSPILVAEASDLGFQLGRAFEPFFAPEAVGGSADPALFIALVRARIRETRQPISDRETWWFGRRQLIRKYIDTHLDDPNLGPLQICELFNMSRATLYRMFEEDGGVRRRIQDRRLQSAMWDLATEGVKRGRLSQVAERWGFSSDANFNRAVKQTFGMPPGTLFLTSVHADVAAPAPAVSESRFTGWGDLDSEGDSAALAESRQMREQTGELD